MNLWVACQDTSITEHSFIDIIAFAGGHTEVFSTSLRTILMDLQRIDPTINCFLLCRASGGSGDDRYDGYVGIVAFSAEIPEDYVPSMAYYDYFPYEYEAGVERLTGIPQGQTYPYCYWDGKLEQGHLGVTYYVDSVTVDNINYGYHSGGDSSHPNIACLLAKKVNINGSEHETDEDPYSTSTDSQPDGGHGDFDYSGDPILPPDLPTISAVDTGFVTLFEPSLTQLKDLASYMWSGLFDVATFKKIFADPMDCIISLSIIPVNAPTGAPAEIKVGNIGTGINASTLSQQFVKVKFNTLNIGLRTNSFANYSPYTKCQLFLPYVGCQTLNIDDIAGADIDIEYHIDLFSGSCTAYVTCGKRNSDGSRLKATMYQFTGNVVANIPFTATNFQSFISSMLGTLTAAGAAVATGGGAAGILGSSINTAMSMKPDVERSGNLAATSGFLGIQKPYLILTYPNLCIPENRDKTVGTPSFIGLGMLSGYGNRKLSDFHGLTIMHRVNVKNIPCTEAEKEMIAAQLTGEGVIMP